MSLSLEKQFAHTKFIKTIESVDDLKALRQIAIDLHHLYLAQQDVTEMLKNWNKSK